MTLTELAESVGTTPRQIRFMIAEGVLPAAQKTGRNADAYHAEHVLKAQRYLGLHRLGMKPASIKVLLAFDGAIPIMQSQGIELRISPLIDPEDINLELAMSEISAALIAFTQKG